MKIIFKIRTKLGAAQEELRTQAGQEAKLTTDFCGQKRFQIINYQQRKGKSKILDIVNLVNFK